MEDQPQKPFLSFHEKLKEIARIEQEHNFIGARVLLKDKARNSSLTSEDIVDVVLDSMREAVKLSERMDTLSRRSGSPSR